MSLAPLEIVDCPKPEKVALGELPKLEFLDIAKLRIDESYQRPVMAYGRKNIAQIVSDFRWNRFSPLIVTPVSVGLFAIIDGQHRAIAAQCIGIKKVPCQIVKIAPNEGGKIFAAINTQITPMSAQYVFKAARASGEEWALALDRVCKKAGIELLTYPVQTDKQKPRQTMIVGTLRARLRQFGPETLAIALEGMMKSPKAEVAGFCRAITVDQALVYVRNTPNALNERAAVIDALSRIDFVTVSGARRGRNTLRGHGPTFLRLINRTDESKILDLRKRRFPLNAIATTLRIPYADVQRVVDGASS